MVCSRDSTTLNLPNNLNNVAILLKDISPITAVSWESSSSVNENLAVFSALWGCSKVNQFPRINEKILNEKMGTCSHLPFVIMGHISGENLRKFRKALVWPWTSSCYVIGKRQEEKKSKILFLSLLLMQYTCLKYCLKSHRIASSQVEFLCTLKDKA